MSPKKQTRKSTAKKTQAARKPKRNTTTTRTTLPPLKKKFKNQKKGNDDDTASMTSNSSASSTASSSSASSKSSNSSLDSVSTCDSLASFRNCMGGDYDDDYAENDTLTSSSTKKGGASSASLFKVIGREKRGCCMQVDALVVPYFSFWFFTENEKVYHSNFWFSCNRRLSFILRAQRCARLLLRSLLLSSPLSLPRTLHCRKHGYHVGRIDHANHLHVHFVRGWAENNLVMMFWQKQFPMPVLRRFCPSGCEKQSSPTAKSTTVTCILVTLICSTRTTRMRFGIAFLTPPWRAHHSVITTQPLLLYRLTWMLLPFLVEL